MPSAQSKVGKRAWLALLVAAVSAAVGYWVSQSDVSESNTSARGPASDLSSDPLPDLMRVSLIQTMVC